MNPWNPRHPTLDPSEIKTPDSSCLSSLKTNLTVCLSPPAPMCQYLWDLWALNLAFSKFPDGHCLGVSYYIIVGTTRAGPATAPTPKGEKAVEATGTLPREWAQALPAHSLPVTLLRAAQDKWN